MYKRLLVFILVLSTLQVPMTVATSYVLPSTMDSTNSYSIESQLKLELESISVDTILAEESEGVSTILQFNSELTSSEIETAERLGVEFNYRNGVPVHIGSIYTSRVFDLSTLHLLSELGLVHASSGSKQFYPALASSVPAIDAPAVWSEFEKNGENIDGTGTLAAVIDTGASWLHPSLWRASTSNLDVLADGPDFYVDLDEDGVVDTNEGPINTVTGQSGSSIDYGDDYMFIDLDDNGRFDYADGDQWLGGIDTNDNGYINLDSEQVVILGESKVAILYDQYTSNVYVRGVNLTLAADVVDANGHGTHVASTIAGGQIGMTDYVGVAPGADLLIIRSPLDSESVLDGIAFAAENGADVINMSFSSYLGFLDGTDIEDLAISEAFMQYGTISTLAAGNLGGRPKHASTTVPSGSEDDFILAVSNPPDYSFLNLLWRSDNNDEHILLTPPNSDEDIDLGVFSEIVGSPFALSHPNISAYVFPDRSTKGMNRIIVQVSTSEHFWDTGSWTVIITNPLGSDVTLHGYAWDNSWTGNSMKFSSNIDYTHSISSPGTSDTGVTVASYNEVTLSLSSSSSIGPRVDEVSKPILAAPGDSIRAASNSMTSLWSLRSGTSMAAPHAAGVVALIKQASGDSEAWRTLSALYEGSGGYLNHYNDPSNSWGFGTTNPVWSIQHLITPSDSSIYWDGMPLLFEDPQDGDVLPELDILNASIYQMNDSSSFRIGFLGEVDLSTEDVLSIDWDTDNSMATGYLGIDFKVNISEDVATKYTWQGGSFVEVGSATWSNDSSFVFVSFSHEHDAILGRIEIKSGDPTNETLDSTGIATLTNQWSPLVESLEISTNEEDEYSISLEVSDRDSRVSDLGIELQIIDGDLTVLDSTSFDGVYQTTSVLDISTLSSNDMLSLLIHITDGDKDLFLPPLILSGATSLELSISEGHVDQEVVRVGLLISERITGNVTVQGHFLASSVRLSLQLSYGLKYNVTLSGTNGVYDFDISPSNLSPGDYDVYAAAISQSGEEVSLLIDELTIIEDYSNVILIGGLGIGLVAIVFLTKRYKT